MHPKANCCFARFQISVARINTHCTAVILYLHTFQGTGIISRLYLYCRQNLYCNVHKILQFSWEGGAGTWILFVAVFTYQQWVHLSNSTWEGGAGSVFKSLLGSPIPHCLPLHLLWQPSTIASAVGMSLALAWRVQLPGNGSEGSREGGREGGGGKLLWTLIGSHHRSHEQ
jgi:hypothetical protein